MLNHLIITDSTWMSRMEHGVSLREIKPNAIPHEDFAELRATRIALRARIAGYVVGLAEAVLAAPLSYATSAGVPFTQPLHHVLGHFFNHQTHHRGQAHHLLGTILDQRETPVLDLLAYQRSLLRAGR